MIFDVSRKQNLGVCHKGKKKKTKIAFVLFYGSGDTLYSDYLKMSRQQTQIKSHFVE